MKEEIARELQKRIVDLSIFESNFIEALRSSNEYLERLHAVGNVSEEEYQSFKKAFTLNQVTTSRASEDDYQRFKKAFAKNQKLEK